MRYSCRSDVTHLLDYCTKNAQHTGAVCRFAFAFGRREWWELGFEWPDVRVWNVSRAYGGWSEDRASVSAIFENRTMKHFEVHLLNLTVQQAGEYECGQEYSDKNILPWDETTHTSREKYNVSIIGMLLN